jgi:predicted peptidase
VVCRTVTAEPAGYGKVKPEQAAAIAKMEAGVATGKAKLPWRLYVPKEASPNHCLPLVLFLHGAGRRGNDNVGPMELAWEFVKPEGQAKHPCFVLAPQMNKSWVNHQFHKGSYSAEAVPISDEMKTTLELVEQVAHDRPIDPNRLYVVGQSMGGFGTWDAMIRRPDLWAAGVPICGGGDPSQAARIKDIAVWAWHGADDTMVPVSGSREMIEALKKAGATPRYTEIPKGGHGVWVKAFSNPELFEWLFAQHKPSGPASEK